MGNSDEMTMEQIRAEAIKAAATLHSANWVAGNPKWIGDVIDTADSIVFYIATGSVQ